ncbi:MAG: restriction endonuclease subunit S [Oscillospiraceae bacterium]|nr:restriction endonuclease subunit S [Oscillospiraceae bacterium]
MNALQLKNSILQMAVQGKLVSQDPNDEPASALLERIRTEKQRLIKEGKIKKDKNESVIYRAPREGDDGSSNIPYTFLERTGDSTVQDITDELPFDVPDSWEWVRLGSIGDWGSGATPSRNNPEFYKNGNIPWLKTGDLNDGFISEIPEKITPLALTKTSVRLNPIGSVLIAMYGATIGKLGILSIEATTNQACCACFTFTGLYNKYLFYYLFSQRLNFKKQSEGGAQPNISKEKIIGTLFPLPPFAEQKRIVARIEELLPLIEAYDKKYTALENLNANFPDTLKKSILQAAVQGKLVPQDPHDEPASALLERIRSERDRLIRDGKIKRNKDESVIFRRDNSHYEIRGGVERCIDDEIPFDLPDTWAWVRLDYLCEYIQRGKSPKYSLIKKYPVIAQKCNQWNGFRIDKAQFIEPDSLASYAPERILHDGDLLWNSTGLGTLGRIAVYKTALNPYECAVADSHVTVIRPLINYVLSEYLYAYFANPTVQTVIESHSDGTTKQKELATITIKNYFIPLPPLNEQRRIVAQIDAVLPILDNL